MAQTLSLTHIAHFLDATAIGYVRFDETGVIRDCNQTGASMVGLPIKELLGQNFDDGAWRTVHHDGSLFPFADLLDAKGHTWAKAR